MKKSDLVPGKHFVKFRDGRIALIVLDDLGMTTATHEYFINNIISYTNCLLHNNFSKYDIMEVGKVGSKFSRGLFGNIDWIWKRSTLKYKVGDYVSYDGTYLQITGFSTITDDHYNVLPVDKYGRITFNFHNYVYDDNDLKSFTPLKVLMFDGEEIKVGDTFKGRSVKAHLKIVKIFDDYCECDWYADDNNKFINHSDLKWSSRSIRLSNPSRFTSRFTPVTHKEMTVGQIEKALGHPFKIIK